RYRLLHGDVARAAGPRRPGHPLLLPQSLAQRHCHHAQPRSGAAFEIVQPQNVLIIRNPRQSALRTASRTRDFASSRLVSRTAPAASRWPPPPNPSAILATSIFSRERKLTFTPPAGCSRKNKPTSTPAKLRV